MHVQATHYTLTVNLLYSPVPGKDKAVFCPYGFAFARVSYEYKHTVYSLFLKSCFFFHLAFDTRPLCSCISNQLLSTLGSIPLYGHHSLLIHHLLRVCHFAFSPEINESFNCLTFWALFHLIRIVSNSYGVVLFYKLF